MLIFYFKFLFLYSGVGLGVWGAMKFYFLVRIIESHWFVWVTQSNHIPMNIEDDAEEPWFPLQVRLIEKCQIIISIYIISRIFLNICFIISRKFKRNS